LGRFRRQPALRFGNTARVALGSKDYLLREFAKTPARISQLFYTAFNTRLVLLLLSLSVTFLLFSLLKAGIWQSGL
jgi:hypothetical protein